MKKLLMCLICANMVLNVNANERISLGKEKIQPQKNLSEVPFSVKTKQTSFKAGEKVEFEIQGNPKSVEFFSGESGGEYNMRNGRLLPSGMELSFFIRFHMPAASWPIDNPEWGAIPWDKISLLVSTDFTGDYSFSGIKKATWIDVTDRVKFPTVQARTEATGPIDLSDLTKVGKPFYFAFRLVDNHLKRPAFLIQKPEWYTILPEGKELIGHLKSGEVGENTINLQQVDEDPQNTAEVIYIDGPKYNDRFTIRRKNSRGSLGKQTWLVSKKFDGVKEVLGKKSSPVYIKSIADSPIKNHSHMYSTPGTYEACFVVTTLAADGKKHEDIKKVKIVVEK